jgi:ATP-binding cassette subfamily B multidrug efflux pump
MKKNGTIKRLLLMIKPQLPKMFYAFICAVMSVGATLYCPVLTGRAIDAIISPGNVGFSDVKAALITLIPVIAALFVFGILMSLITNKVCYRAVKEMRVALFSKICGVPIKTIDDIPAGEWMSRMVTDVDQVADGLLQGATQLFSGIVTILMTLAFMLSINWVIALVVVALTPLSLVLAAVIAKGSQKMFSKQSVLQGNLGGMAEEMFGAQRVLTSCGATEMAQEGMDKINADLKHWGFRAQIYASFTNPSTRFVNGLVYAAVALAGGLSAVSGGMTIGAVSCFLSYANQYTKPFNEVTGIMAQLQTAMMSAERIFALMDMQDETPDSALPAPERKDGEVEFRHVSFRYVPERPMIEDFSLKVKSGMRVAIVGPTGCGKTTLINLLMRFYDVQSGAILVDGVDIRDMKREELRSCFGMVLQETFLTTGTVAENIAFGRESASREEVIAAAKAVHADGFIRQMDDGYDTVLSNNGEGLSQGQKQLICIARVMLLQPPMLILDEATSSIDTLTEQRVQRAFEKLMKGRTAFVVAHRLSTIQSSDLILVMRQGKIVESGTHDELLRAGGFYKQLYESQFD